MLPPSSSPVKAANSVCAVASSSDPSARLLASATRTALGAATASLLKPEIRKAISAATNSANGIRAPRSRPVTARPCG